MSILKKMLIARFELRYDGVFPLDEAEAAQWKIKRDWALAIIRRNAAYNTPTHQVKKKKGRTVSIPILSLIHI